MTMDLFKRCAQLAFRRCLEEEHVLYMLGLPPCTALTAHP